MDTVNLTALTSPDSGQRSGSVPRQQDQVERSNRLETAPSAPAADTGKGQSDRHALDEAVSNLNDYVQQQNRSLEFSVDDVTGRDIVKVIDSDTEQVIRQFPPEEVLDMARTLQENAGEDSGGLFLQTEA